MATVQDPQVQPLPGQDHPDHTKTHRLQVASDLSKIYGVDYQAGDLVPSKQQEVPLDGTNELLDKVKTEGGWEETKAGFTGKSRTDSSGNFMKVLMNRLVGKKNRDQEGA